MLDKLNMSKREWGFTGLFFILAVAYTIFRTNIAGWKAVQVSFYIWTFSSVLGSALAILGLLAIYLICTLLPSRKIVIVPSVLILMVAAQEFTLAYYAFMSVDIIGGFVLLIETSLILFMAYLNAKISFTIIDGAQSLPAKLYLKRWWSLVKLAVKTDWKLFVNTMLLYIILNASIVITFILK
jgi:hypothetical protein